MKDLWSIFIIGIAGLVIFSGIGVINMYMFQKGNLDSESNNLVISYDQQLSGLAEEFNITYTAIYSNGTNQLETEGNVNTLEAFIKEYGEAKQKISTLRRTTNMITSIPDMVFLSVPFVEAEDIDFYKRIAFLIILVAIGIAIFRALFVKQTSTTP